MCPEGGWREGNKTSVFVSKCQIITVLQIKTNEVPRCIC